MTTTDITQQPVTLKRIYKTWWPLAASWLMMGLSLPLLSATMARLPNPEINLAAYGGIVQPLGQFFVAPMVMMLGTSTALCKDWASYLKIKKFLFFACGGLTLLHILVAFTPLYYFVVENILSAPQEIIEPARVGLMIATPWAFIVGYRRFQQGVMIRFGYSKAVGFGTITRLSSNVIILLIGYWIGSIPGVILGISAHIIGMSAEALYSHWRVRPILRNELRNAPEVDLISWKDFFAFYMPLVLTVMLNMIWLPIGTAGISRMPNALVSLAVWPVINGATFIVRSFGMSYLEVVVALLDKPGSFKNLQHFTNILVIGTSIFFLLTAATPFADFWFRDFSALAEELVPIAKNGYWLIFLLPMLNVLRSWYQGTLMTNKTTKGVSESIIISLFTFMAVLIAGILFNRFAGVYVAMTAMIFGTSTQVFWLWLRSSKILKKMQKRDVGIGANLAAK